MREYVCFKLAAVAASGLLVVACGGGSTGGGRPAVAPTPPPPPPPPPAAPAPFGATSDIEFATVGDEIAIRWDSTSKSYELSASEGEWERLTYLPSSLGGEHYASDGSYFLLVKDQPYQYTARATVHENAFGFEIGDFAFGLPTAPGDVPTTGSATFEAQVWGTGTNPGLSGGTYYEVTGAARLAFDFGAGSLNGYMDTQLTGPTGTFSTPRYEFTQIVFSVGSDTFSGSFLVPGSTAGSDFAGRFTGPQAAELMARWQAPFLDSTSGSGTWGTMGGIWIGKRGD